MPSPTKLGTIVAQNSSLRQLFREAADQSAVFEAVRQLVDEPLRDHLRFALVRGDTLVLITDTPAWAAKLRYQVAEIKRRIETLTGLPRFRSIRVKVASAAPSGKTPARRPRAIGRQAARQLREQAETIDDPAVREAMMKIAARGRSEDGEA